MDKKEIQSVWAAWQEVQEKKKAPVTNKDDDGEGMDPVGKEDGDVDNDGDKDSSDEYLKNRRKAISKNVKEGEESPYPSLDKKKREKKGSNLEEAGGPANKLKEGEHDKPYPAPEQKKKPGDALEPVNNRTAKLKGDIQGESVEEATKGKGPISTAIKTAKGAVNTISSTAKTLNMGASDEDEEGEKVDCPKCKGKGCDHCDDKGYHMKEDYEYFVENLSDEELEDYIEWLNEEVELDELSNKLLKRYSKKAKKAQDYHDDREVNSKPGSAERAYHARKLSNRIQGADRADQKRFDRKNPVESVDRMDLYLEALRNMPNDQLDELSVGLKNRAAGAALAKGQMHRQKADKAERKYEKQYSKGKTDVKDYEGGGLTYSNKMKKAGQKMQKHDRIADKKMAQSRKFSAAARAESTAYDIIDQVVESRIRSRLENLLSPWELEAIEEKAKHVGTKGPEPAPQEEFMSTSSPNDKKIYKDHEKGSDKKLEDYEDMSEKDGAKAGRAVKSQSPTRRGEKRIGDIAMPKPTKMKGQ